MDLEVARNFLIALSIGALIGIEREKKRGAEPGRSVGGIRTHILLALIGAASAWQARELAMDWIFVVTLAVVGIAVVANQASNRIRDPENASGLLSEVAALASCLLGAMVVVGHATLAVALAVATSAVLAYKQPLHGLVDRIGVDDIYAGIKLLIATFIVLPLLPDATIDPLGAINPHNLWLLVILISGLSLVGYVAVRWVGTTHGIALTGITGGLVSSTAVTLNFARSSRLQPDPAQAHAFSAGILLAWLVMFVRALTLVAIVNASMLRALWLPFALMGAVTLVFAVWHYRASLLENAPVEQQGVAVANPFSLGSAIRFGAMFALVLVIVKLAQEHAPGTGVYVVSALAGSVDIDPLILSVAKQNHENGQLAQAGTAIVIAILANTAVKCIMVASMGAGPIRRHIAAASAAVMAVGLAVALLG
ncbi:MgtC/SapB family protein [Janthinobacterium sp. 17J80-10]|uniref:MgtC/SapB family protein n=1 Tax=Janthinobacterium sp. 17J80-10 TaxID=2497863 RepID=UPI0010054C8D|nr:MgtC/SapB family protein [Janthinobacterium sp. 17J80-10]QAU35201.1 MgtC/SapB family protein [Janthinobacterium sp. 17J80-10]